MHDQLTKRRAPNFNGKWFHIIASTYGAWLPGDPRGFRTRHQRQHVDGDYKRPPRAGAYGTTYQHSLNALKQPPVRIASKWRRVIGNALCEKLVKKGAFVLCLAVSQQHVHLLAKLPIGVEPRTWMGYAKSHATLEVKKIGWEGELWAKRGKELPIKDRRHQLNVYRYILAHREQGAWVWDWMAEEPE